MKNSYAGLKDPFNGTLTSTSSPSQSRPGSNGNEGVYSTLLISHKLF